MWQLEHICWQGFCILQSCSISSVYTLELAISGLRRMASHGRCLSSFTSLVALRWTFPQIRRLFAYMITIPKRHIPDVVWPKPWKLVSKSSSRGRLLIAGLSPLNCYFCWLQHEFVRKRLVHCLPILLIKSRSRSEACTNCNGCNIVHWNTVLVWQILIALHYSKLKSSIHFSDQEHRGYPDHFGELNSLLQKEVVWTS